MKKDLPAGVMSEMEKAIAFVTWMQSRTKWPHYRDIMAAFDCSRATANRWRRSYSQIMAKRLRMAA